VAKLPDDTAFGDAPSAHSGRGIASYDVASSIARAGNAQAQATETLGKGIAAAGDGLGAVARHRGNEDDKLDMAKGKSHTESKWIELDSEFAKDTDYATRQERYDARLTEIRNEGRALIRNTKLHERFDVETEPVFQRRRALSTGRAQELEGSHNRAWAEQQGNTWINQGAAEPDEGKRQQLIDWHNDLITAQQSKGWWTAEQALHHKQKWAKQFIVTGAQARLETDPEGLVNDLRSSPGTPEAITNRIVGNEKGRTPDAKNPFSSATGDGQFIETTWLDVIKRHRPDLAEGRTPEQILKLRADPDLSRAMTEAYRGENTEYLKRAGLPATPGQQYLAHFLGPGTAAAVLKADPNKPIAEVLVETVGEKRAQKIIAANQKVLDGKLSGSVVAWSDKLMGGAAGNGRQIYDILPPADRAQLLSQAETKLAQRKATDLSGFTQRVEDGVTEARRTGTVVNRITEDEFIGKLGAEKGAKAFADYELELQNGADVRDVANMDPGAQSALLERNAPEAGADGFARQQKRQDAIATAISKVNKEKVDDPAAFAIARLPVVHEAYTTFSETVNNPTASPAMKAAAARDLAFKMDMEQTRVGIPATDRTIVPKAYVQALNDKLSEPAKAGGTLNVAAMLNNEAQIWGENWPKVYRELAKDAEPVVRVIGSGVTPLASQLLVELKGMSAGDILKDQSEERMSGLRTALRTAMAPFARSLAGNEGANKILHDFEGQALKLTAYWTAQGQSPDAAAAEAFKQLLGHKYEFGDTWRVPKSVGLTRDEVKQGAAGAMNALGTRPSGAPQGKFAGQLEPGNIDLDNRPQVKVGNDVATVRSMSVNFDGQEVLIPTVSNDGRLLEEREAIELYRKTGKHLGKFDTPANADAYGRALSEQQGRRYGGNNPFDIAPARDNVGGLSPAYLERETLRAIKRDGVWVTAPDESGLALIYNDQAVRRRDGSPVIVPWSQMKELGKGKPASGVPFTGRIYG